MVTRRRILYGTITAMLLSATLLIPAAADLNLIAGDSAIVAYTGGDGLVLRAEPGGEVLAYLAEGYPLVIQDGYWASDGNYWYAVSVDLEWGWTTGYVLSDYVSGDLGGSTFVYEGDAAASQVPIVVNTGGGSLNMRANPWSSAAILTSIPDGTWIEVLAPSIWDDAGIAWSEVRYAGMVGYAASDYIGYKAFGSTIASNDLWVGSLAVIIGTGGDGVYMRDDVYGTPLVVLPEGTVGDIIDGPRWDTDGARLVDDLDRLRQRLGSRRVPRGDNLGAACHRRRNRCRFRARERSDGLYRHTLCLGRSHPERLRLLRIHLLSNDVDPRLRLPPTDGISDRERLLCLVRRTAAGRSDLLPEHLYMGTLARRHLHRQRPNDQR